MTSTMRQESEISRRQLLCAAGLLATAGHAQAAPVPQRLKISIFSKHLQFLDGAALAAKAAELKFDGVDLTVRKGGHVEPENVKKDLPALVKTIREHSLDVYMISTELTGADSPSAEDILGTCSQLGIHYVRWGGLRYTGKQPILQEIAGMRPGIAQFSKLNERHRTCAIYHAHSGINLVGASIWDLRILFKDLNPKAIAINYDIGHATVEGGFGGWGNSFRVAEMGLGGVAVKDFLWKPGPHGRWEPDWCPLGKGMVAFPSFFKMVRASSFSGPLQLHFEYPLGGADLGKRQLTIPADDVYKAMSRDLAQLRSYLTVAGLPV